MRLSDLPAVAYQNVSNMENFTAHMPVVIVLSAMVLAFINRLPSSAVAFVGMNSFVGLWVGIVHLGHTVVLGRSHADSHGYQLFGISAATAFVAPLHRGRYPYRQCARCACRLHGVAYRRRGYRCRSRFHSLPPHSYRAHINAPASVTLSILPTSLCRLPLRSVSP